VALEAEAYASILRDAPEAGIAGGRVYDAVIAACARKERVQTLLTFNESHFRQFAASGLQVVAP
jgi:predicted nucleic acid-binding protein